MRRGVGGRALGGAIPRIWARSARWLAMMVVVVMAWGLFPRGLLLGGLPVRALGNTALAAEGVYCRDRDDHQICILSIKRSAKNFWEYRAIVSIDAQVQPLATYDCLNRLWIDPEGYAEDFSRHPAGPVICQIFRRKRYDQVPPVL